MGYCCENYNNYSRPIKYKLEEVSCYFYSVCCSESYNDKINPSKCGVH